MEKQDITILYVEDEEIIRTSMVDSLKLIVSNVVSASDGEEGYNAYLNNKIDLIITDINMPKLNGFEMLVKIREINPNAFAIIVSGYDYSEMLEGMSKIDKYNDYIQKPFKLKNLFSLVFHNIEKIRLHKESQEAQNLLIQYKNVIDKSAIFIKTDENGVINYVNNEYCEISKFGTNEILGKKCHILEDSSMHENLWNSIHKNREFKCQMVNTKADGANYFTDSTIFPIYDLQENIIEFAIISFDITEHITAIANAKNAERAKSSFLAQMSHEIRTPLNGIIGFANLLEHGNIPQKELGFVKIINSSATHLLYIINEILDFSKIESGKITIENIIFDAAKEFADVITLFTSVASQKGVNLVKNIDSNIPSRLRGDPFRIKQVMSNLISNAIKFTPQSKNVTVTIQLSKLEINRCTINFSVQDEGIGIKKEDQQKIFTSFSQADESISRNFGGTGLGLSISSNITNLLGGEIKLQSELDVGSNFYFSLNFEIAQENSEILVQSKDMTKDEFSGKVLVADDNETNRMLIDAILGEKKVERTIVENGEIAVNEIKKTIYNLILMDINMPVLDGVQAMKQIKEYQTKNDIPLTPIIALTANSVYGDKEKYIENGFDGYLSKPLEIDELNKILSTYLHISNIPIAVCDFSASFIYDVASVATILGIKPEILKMLLDKFLETIFDEINTLKTYLKNEDFSNTRLLSHSLKGASGSLKIVQMYEILKEVEADAKAGIVYDYTPRIEALKEIATKLKGSY